MDATWIVRLTNRIALLSVTLLIFWVVIFSVNMVFDLKIFRAHLTEAFGFSILGILSVLAGVLMINVMLNLSRIADSRHLNKNELNSTSHILSWSGQKYLSIVVIAMSLIILLMFIADARTRAVKKSLMLDSAQSLAQQYEPSLSAYANAPLNAQSVGSLSNSIKLMVNSADFVQRVEVIRVENIAGQLIPISVTAYDEAIIQKNEDFKPENHIFKASKEQREYIQKVAQGQISEPLYYAKEGQYWLMLPLQREGKNLIMYIDDYQRYGKIGS